VFFDAGDARQIRTLVRSKHSLRSRRKGQTRRCLFLRCG